MRKFGIFVSAVVFALSLMQTPVLADKDDSLGVTIGYLKTDIELDGTPLIYNYSNWDGGVSYGLEYDKVFNKAIGRFGVSFAQNMDGDSFYASSTFPNFTATTYATSTVSTQSEISDFIVFYFDIIVPISKAATGKKPSAKANGFYAGGGLSYSIVRADQDYVICATERNTATNAIVTPQDCASETTSMNESDVDFNVMLGYSSPLGLDGSLKYFVSTKTLSLSLGYHF